ncbi:hypothetical protein CR513_24765, partial [Mucuna pruriens]
MKNTFDKRVRPRVFKEGDLVLKKRLPNVKDPWGKWAPNYEGPYVVKQEFSGGAVILADSNGQELTHPVNAGVVKIFYPWEFDQERIRRINLQVSKTEESMPTVIDSQLKALGPQLVLICTP